ncbi:DUF6691 family protein [Telmatospirillum sp.]|uniref:DUF6691 family protein n=1 Tax=Telmatospirillum sp. TaxID=2079197 RepID=UPI00284218DD|nr:DUF6691 family protein [Telmatospirillum sp.]MDR3436878.1 hypothetical protein [Telmatospirillum sp.]
MLIRAAVALLAGLLFGAGLALSGMINPAKVLGFLDIAGHWDPSLAGVMAAAIPVTALLYRLAGKRGSAVAGGPLPGPAKGIVDFRLVGGAAVFGLGWGLAGLCPGPAIADMVLDPRVMIFVVAMAVGMVVAKRLSGSGV